MKKVVLFFALIWSAMSFAQFKVSGSSTEWKTIGKYLAVIELSTKTDSTKAMIKYLDYDAVLQRNIFSPTVDYSFEFSTDKNTLDDLYNLITDKLKNKKIEVVTLDFPEGKMYLNFDYSTFSGYYMTFQFDNNSLGLDKNSSGSKRSSYGLTLDRINKIFGKVKKKKW